MLYPFFPLLILFLLTGKIIFFYCACVLLAIVMIGPFFEESFGIVKEVAGADETKEVAKWVFGILALIVVYFMMH